MPSVEGLNPEILWYTLVGLVGIGALVVLGDKVADVFRKRKERQRIAQQPTEEFAETVSQRVMDKLDPRFAEIDRKLANDKVLIDDHSSKLANLAATVSGQNERLKIIEDGNRVLCRGIIALLSHEINGNSVEKLETARQEITDYLIDK